MEPNKRTRPGKRKRLASRVALSTRAGAAGPGTKPSSPLSGRLGRFLSRFSRRGALAALALGLLAGICYLPAMLRAELIWDDSILSRSEAVQEWSGLGVIWSWPVRIEGEAHYWPLTYTTFWLEHKLWGLAPAGYRVVNVLLHLANCLLLWGLLLRLAVPGAWAAAALFAVHPVHVDSVAWIIERKDVLSGLFYLTAIWVWLGFLERPRPWRYGLALLLLAAGLLSKSIVVTLPAALLILQWWKNGRITLPDLQRVAPFFLVAGLLTAADLYSHGLERYDTGHSLPERVLVASRALWFYAGKLVWPTELAIVYPIWNVSLGDPWAWLYLAGAAALAAALWLARRRIGRGPLAGALFFAVTLSPVLGFVDHPFMRFSLVADRFQYLAGIGMIAVIAGAAVQGARRLSGGWKRGAAGLLPVLLALLGTATWRQSTIYQGNLGFWSHVVSQNPRALNAHRQLAPALTEVGRLEEALAAARIAVERVPDAQSHFLLGTALLNLKRLEEAEESFYDALELHHNEETDPKEETDPEKDFEIRFLVELGRTAWNSDRHPATEKYFGRVLEIDPGHREALRHLAASYTEQKRYQEALDLYRTLSELDPDDAETHVNVGAALHYLDRREEAIRSLERALALDPTLEAARENLEAMRGSGR